MRLGLISDIHADHGALVRALEAGRGEGRPMKIRHGPIWLLGSVAGTRTRDSFTCALVELPSLAMEVFSLGSGEPISFARAPDEDV